MTLGYSRMNLSVKVLVKIREKKFLRLLCISNEIHFQLAGYTNKRNCAYWPENNRHELRD